MAKTPWSREEMRVKLLKLSGTDREEDWTDETTVATINEILDLSDTIVKERDEAVDLYIKDFTTLPESNNSTGVAQEPDTKPIEVSEYINKEYL